MNNNNFSRLFEPKKDYLFFDPKIEASKINKKIDASIEEKAKKIIKQVKSKESKKK